MFGRQFAINQFWRSNDYNVIPAGGGESLIPRLRLQLKPFSNSRKNAVSDRLSDNQTLIRSLF